MASRELASRLEDILAAIAVIEAYTSGKTFDDYAAERMLRDAVERNIERISEASRHISKSLEAKHHEIPWRNMPASAISCATPIRSWTTAWSGKWWSGISRP